ncbi:odorant receptor 85c-like [Phlebotomus argentipes]|uniref:odorant receptor 85c-like n=1 Tax=Phlebotomus argentipes TaxID=94469 RepID=UPI0028933A7F|nr:odorant receptor 85c-like [Phlebotomus argentipes]
MSFFQSCNVEGRYWLKLPFFPEENHYYYEVTVGFHVFCFVSFAFLYPLTDSPYIVTGIHLMGFLDAMKSIVGLMNDPKSSSDHPKILKHVYLLHLELIDMLKDFNRMMYVISLTQFLCNISLLVFIMSILMVTSDEYIMYLCGFSVVLQVFVLCLFGEIIAMKTENITYELCQINWYDLPIPQQRNLLFILLISQRNYALKAGGMYTINMYAFIQILKIGITYAALMRTFV